MNAKSIAEQARERARIALEQTKLQKQEIDEQKKQEKAQRERPDYPDLLRAKVISGLTVEKTGDYTDDLAAFQKGMQNFVVAIPDVLLLAADCNTMRALFHNTVKMLSVVPEIPAYLMERNPSEDHLKPYIDTVLKKNLYARTYSSLLANPEIRQRIFETCEPISLEARLNTLAGEVQSVTPTPEEAEVFQAKCRERWVALFVKIEEVNQLGYIQSGGVYVVRDRERNSGWRESSGLSGYYPIRTTDAVYTVTQMRTEINKEVMPFVNRLKPILETLASLNSKIEAVPAASQKNMKELFYLHDGDDNRNTFGHLIHALEEFGVWSTNQCIDTHSRPYYLGSATEPLLEVVKQYAEISPMAAACILFLLSSRIGSSYGYNCPGESMVDNSKEPRFWIEALKVPAVTKVFEEKQDPKWITKQLERLLAISKESASWEKGLYGKFFWREDRTPQQVAELWLTQRTDEAFWEKDKDQRSA